jgi:hypothetical protein
MQTAEIPQNILTDLAKSLTVENPDQYKLAHRFVTFHADANQFPVCFDEAWKLLGCSRKDSAKRSFMKCGFVEDEDYKITKVFKNGNLPDKTDLLQSVEVTTPSENRLSAVKGAYREDIFLTPTCFDEFAITVNKGVRRFFVRCKDAVLRLKAQIEAGEIKIVKRNGVAEIANWQYERENCVNAHKELMNTLAAGVQKDYNSPAFYGSFNGQVNKTVSGYTKKEMAQVVGEKGKNSSWIQRDYFGEEQLNLCNSINKLITRRIIAEKATTALEKEKIRKEVCEAHESVAKKLYHGTHLSHKRKRNKALNAQKALPAAGQRPTLNNQNLNGTKNQNTINNYFAPVTQNQIAP